MKTRLTLVMSAVVLAGCADMGMGTAEREPRPGTPRYIAVCEVESPDPGTAFVRHVFGEPTRSDAEATINSLGCSRSSIEPYTTDRFQALQDTDTPLS